MNFEQIVKQTPKIWQQKWDEVEAKIPSEERNKIVWKAMAKARINNTLHTVVIDKGQYYLVRLISTRYKEKWLKVYKRKLQQGG